MDAATQRRLTHLEAEVASFRRQRTRRTNWRNRLPLGLVALLVALVPLGIAAAGPMFSDIGEAAEVHRPNIQTIGDAGITTGFADPNNPNARLYNPKGLVTREEMASFLARTAGLGGNPPVANAQTAQSIPDGSVTTAKLNPAGSTAGQVLTATSSGVAWQNVASGDGLVRVFGAATDPRNTGGTLNVNLIPAEAESPSSYQQLLTLNYVAPVDGYVQVTAVLWIGREPGPQAGEGNVGALARVRPGDDTTGERASVRQGTYVEPDGALGATITITWVFTVTAGPHSLILEAGRFAPKFGTGEIQIYNHAMTAVFAPSGGMTVAR